MIFRNWMSPPMLISGLLSAFLVVPVVFMALDDTVPIEYDVVHSYISPSQPRAGDQIKTHWKVSRFHRSCEGRITRVIVDVLNGVRTVYDPVEAILIQPHDEVFERTFLLPRSIQPGPKTYHVEALYRCNLLQHWFPLAERQPDLSFEVMP